MKLRGGPMVLTVVLVLAFAPSGLQGQGQRTTVLEDFEKNALQGWEGPIKLSGDRSAQGAASGLIRFSQEQGTASLTGFPEDWTGYDHLRFDIYCERGTIPALTLRILEQGAGDPGRSNLDHYFEANRRLPLLKGWNHIEVELPLVAASFQRDLSMDRIYRLTLSVSRTGLPFTISIDNFRLTTGEEGADTASRTAPQDGLIRLDGRWFDLQQVARPEDVPEAKSVTRLRREAERERDSLERTITGAKLQGLETIYQERHLVTADLGLGVRPLLPWFNNDERKQEMFEYVVRSCREGRHDLEDQIRGRVRLPEGDDTHTGEGGFEPFPALKGTPVNGWFYRDRRGEPMYVISLHSRSQPLQRFFATPNQHIESYSVGGGSRWTIDESPVYEAFNKYPDTHRVGWDGWCGHLVRDLSSMGGSKMENVVICLESPHILKAIEEYIRTNTPKFAANPNLLYDIMAYELMYICYCDRSQQMFRDWLEKKHGVVEKANEKWGTSYGSFAEVVAPPVKNAQPLPDTNRALWYDWTRFNMDRFTDHLLWVKQQIRRWDPDTPLASGGSSYMLSGSVGTSGIDEERIVNEVDDIIIHEGSGSTLGMDLQLALSETEKPLADPEMNLGSVEYVLPHALHGKSVMQFFHWPPQPSAEYPGMTQQSSLAHGTNFSLKDIGELCRAALDARRLNNEIAAFIGMPADVAILYSQTSTLQIPPGSQRWATTPYLAELHNTYEASQYLDSRVTFVTERQIVKGKLGQYKLLLVPAARNVPGDVAEEIWKYAEAGGSVMLLPESLLGDEYNRPQDYLARIGLEIQTTRLPKTSTGALEQRYDQSFSRSVSFSEGGSVTLTPQGTHPASSIAELSTRGIRQVFTAGAKAETLFEYPDGMPAIVRIPMGNGTIVFSGSSLEPKGYARLLDALFTEAGASRPVRVKDYDDRGKWRIEARFANLGERKLLYVVNFNDEPRKLRVEAPAEFFDNLKELRSGNLVEGDTITVPPHQTSIYEMVRVIMGG